MRIYLAVMIALAMLACSAPDKPVIDNAHMVRVLTDVRMLEGYYSARYERVDSSGGKMDAWYNELFTKHGITKEQFTQSYAWYNMHPEQLRVIEEKVLDTLNFLLTQQKVQEQYKSQ